MLGTHRALNICWSNKWNKLVSDTSSNTSSIVMLLLLLLLSCFSHVRLCVTPETAAHQIPGTLQARSGVGCHFLLQCMKVKSESEVAQSCPTPSDPMDCSPPGSCVHGIFQARVLEWGAIAFSKYSNRNEHFGTTHCTVCFMLVSSLTSQSFNGCALLSPFYRWRHRGTGK